MQQWLPEDNLVYFIMSVIKELDLRVVKDLYKGITTFYEMQQRTGKYS